MQKNGNSKTLGDSSCYSDQVIDTFTEGFVRKSARELVGKYGFKQQDRDDIEQQLYLKLVKHLCAADPDDPQWKAFVAKTVRRNIASMIRDSQAEKRDHRRACSIHIRIETGEGPLELANLIGENDIPTRRSQVRRGQQELAELMLDMAESIAEIPDKRHKEFCERLKHGSISQVAREMGIPRTTLSGTDVGIQKSVNRTGDHSNNFLVALPAGKAVTSWVKTDANTAACNLPGGHGYTDGNFDVYWDGGVRYGVPGTISTNALTLDGGTGTDFPANDTECVVTKQVQINTAIDGDALVIAALSLEFADPSSTAVGHIDLQDSGNATIAALDLVANQPLVYDVYGGATNIFTGNSITASFASNGSSNDAATLKIVCLEDSTP